MLKIEKFVTPSPEQWEIVIEGMRNPKNSWDRIDSYTTHVEDEETLEFADYEFFMGENDLDLATRLVDGGPVHAKFRRMLPVHVTINAPLYWWKEFDTYKVGTVANSCSTMHKIHSKEFTLEDFSTEHLCTPAKEHIERTIEALNDYRSMFLNFYNEDSHIQKYFGNDKKNVWWQMIQLLPTSYNQKRTVLLNYEVLANIYHWRRNHKLDEWHVFCDWIESLPYSELITGRSNNESHD